MSSEELFPQPRALDTPLKDLVGRIDALERAVYGKSSAASPTKAAAAPAAEPAADAEPEASEDPEAEESEPDPEP